MPLLTTAARCLIEVAEAGSIRKAADLMNLSASAVNRQILNLEEELGVRLLKRLPRGVALTAAGGLVLNRLAGFTEAIAHLHQELQHHTTSRQITVTIGVMDCLVGGPFTCLLSKISTLFPDVILRVEVAFLASELLTRLETGEIDLVVAFEPPEQHGFWAINVIPVPVGVIVSPEHPFSTRPSMALKECYEEQFFLPDRSMILGRRVQSILPGHLRFVPFRTNSMRLIRNFIIQNAGITLMNIIDVWNEVRSGALVFIPLSDQTLSTKLAFCVRDRLANIKEVQEIASSLYHMLAEEVSSLLKKSDS